METDKKSVRKIFRPVGANFFEHIWEESWVYIKTVVDVVHEPILILDKDLRVITANGPFYQTFQVKPKDTENNIVYKLGNGQWNIPALRKLLEDILPQQTYFKGFEVTHEFPTIGLKSMILNARQIYFKGDNLSEKFPRIILLAMEDVTEIMAVAKNLADHTNRFEEKYERRTQELGTLIGKLQKEISDLKKRP